MNVTRREMLKSIIGSALAVLFWDFCGGPTREEEISFCLDIDDEVGRVLKMLCETVIPGRMSDPEGTPGALECCAMNILYDEFYPFKENARPVVNIIEKIAQDKYERSFVELGQAEREDVLMSAEQWLPLISLVTKFIKAAFFTDAYTTLGWEYVGYPGPNLGYINDPDFGVKEPTSKEKTPDGNMP